MDIKKIDIEKIISAEYNPRVDLSPDDKEYQKIKRSIEEFGYIEPIIINKDYTIIGGHQRVKVLKDLGYKEVECVTVDVDKTKEKALNIALNKIDGLWDMPKLKDLLEELDTGDIDIEITGFDFNEIEDLMNQYHVGDMPGDIALDREGSDIKDETTKKLVFGKYKCILTEEEFEKLEHVYLQYVEDNTNSFGFINYLLKDMEIDL